jgi:hypothetical protein
LAWFKVRINQQVTGAMTMFTRLIVVCFVMLIGFGIYSLTQMTSPPPAASNQRDAKNYDDWTRQYSKYRVAAEW